MEPPALGQGASSHRFWAVVAALTTIGLGGTLIDLIGLVPASGHGLTGGCGGMFGVLMLVVLVILVFLGLVGRLAVAGLALFWQGFRWGPRLLLPANLLVMGFYGWMTPVYPGQWLWAIVILLFAAAPALAVILLLWSLATRGRLWVRGLELVALGLIALPLIWLYSVGLTYDIRTGMAAAPPPVASVGCGGGAQSPR